MTLLENEASATYLEPGWPDPIGNHEFVICVEDRNEPGSGNDRFALRVLDKDGNGVAVMSLPLPLADHTVLLGGGNIAVPHGSNGN